MKFTDYLEKKSKKIWERIFSHPFIKELNTGKLSEKRFFYYIRQDWLYSQTFARVLCIIASKADNMESLTTLAEHAAFVVKGEQAMQLTLMKHHSLEELQQTKMQPITYAYTHHLISVARTASFEEGIAAVLPCYWIYSEVGERLSISLPANPVYAEWIKTYNSKDYTNIVDQILALINTLVEKIDKEKKTRILKNYLISSQYEYLFWDQAYNLSQWPF